MSTVLIWFVVIVGIVGILLFWSLVNAAGWADERMEEIKSRETSCEAVITNLSSKSGGMEMDIDHNWYLVDTPYIGDLEYVRARI